MTIGKFITETLPEKILEFIKGAANLFGTLWSGLYDLIIGEATEAADEGTKALEEIDAVSGPAPQLTGWQKFVKNLSDTISDIWKQLPVWIAHGIEMAIAGIDSVISMAGDWIEQLLEEDKKAIVEGGETASEEAVKEMATAADEGAGDGEPELLKAIKNIGERIKDLFVKTIPGFVQDAWLAIGALGGEVFKGIGYIFTGNIPDEDGSITAKIAKAIREFLVEKLPAEIENMWSSIKTFGVDLYHGIANAFGANLDSNERSLAIENIVRNIGSFINDAFNAVKKLFNGEDWKDNFQGTDEQYKAAVRAIEDQQRQANERLTEDSQKPGFWSFVDELKNSLLDALKSIGPAVLNGLATALNWLGDVATYVIESLTGTRSIGEQIDAAYEQEQPELKSALKNIGESIKKFFLETVPYFIGSAIGALIKDMPGWFDKLFGGMNKAMAASADEQADKTQAAAQKEEGPVQAANSLLDVFKNFLNNEIFKAGIDAVKVIAIIAAVIIVLHELKDLLSLSDEMEAVGYTLKWTAISLAMAAVLGILSYIKELSDPANEQRMKNAGAIIDKLKELIGTITTLLSIVTVGKLFDMVGDVAEIAGNGKEKLTVGEKIANGLGGAIGSFFEAIGIGAGTGIGLSLASAGVDTFVDTLQSALVNLASGVETMLSFIDPVINNLVDMNSKMDTAIGTVGKLGDLFIQLYKTFDKIYTEVTGKDIVDYAPASDAAPAWGVEANNGKVTGEEHLPVEIAAFLVDLKDRVEMFNMMVTVIGNLSKTLVNLNRVKDVTAKFKELSDVINSTEFKNLFTHMFDTLYTSFFSSKMKSGLGSDKLIQNLGSSLSIISDAMSVFSDSLSGLSEKKISLLESSLNLFAKLADVVDNDEFTTEHWEKLVKGDTSLSRVGNEIKQFSSYIVSFYSNLNKIVGFKASEISETESKVESVIKVAQGMSTAASMLISYAGNDALTAFSEILPGFGTKVAEFIQSINRGLTGVTADRVELIKTATEAVKNMTDAISLFAYSSGDVVQIAYDNLNYDKGLKFASLLENFLNHIKEALTESDKNQSIFDLGKEFAVRLFTGIQAAFDEDESLRIQITPVLKMDDAVKEQLRQQLSDANLTFNAGKIANSAIGANYQTDTDRVTASKFTDEMALIKAAIANGPTNALTAADMISAFTGIKVVVYPDALAGELAGYIDEQIGAKIADIENSRAVGPG